MTCAFCHRAADGGPSLGPLEARTCLPCARRLGVLLIERPTMFVSLWPVLAEDDDGSPEPKVRLSDGRTVELRERTAELKRELSMDKRLELAEMLGPLGLPREAILEAAFVLREAEPNLVQRALDLLFSERTSPADLAQLERLLLPS
ncbi:MAG: hypothetical protein JST54_00945 [Deltaproteobacteria bacterium]|nr:hypothetical protein [Deltaproteobacteria bacterium]